MKECIEKKVAVAIADWNTFKSGSYNIQTGAKAILLFEPICFESNKAVIELSRVLKKLFQETGEKPTSKIFSEKLTLLFIESKKEIEDENDLELVEWVLRALSE